ncbi:MAG: glycosyltransferase family 2 protein [bacterium]
MREPVSFIIPSYNSKDLLAKIIPQLLIKSKSSREDEIIVVDDCSSDNSIDFIQKNYPEIKILKTEKRSGFAGTANTGVNLSIHNIFMLLNPDISIHEDFKIEPYTNAFKNDKRIFSATPKIIRDTPNGFFNESVPEVKIKKSEINLINLSPLDKYTECTEIIYPCGGASFFDKKKFLEINGFDTIYSPFYFEDFDLGIRAWRNGWKCLNIPYCEVYHQHQGTIGKFNRRYVKLIGKRNYYIFLWKNFPPDFVRKLLIYDSTISLIKLKKYNILGFFWSLLKLKKILKDKKCSKIQDKISINELLNSSLKQRQ